MSRRKSTSTSAPQRPKPTGFWGWLFDITLGNGWRFICWSGMAIVLSIITEWVGMIFWWGTDHSAQLVQQELAYLGSFSRNLLTGFYPADLGLMFISGANRFVNWLHLREMSAALAQSVESAISQSLRIGIESVINIIFVFAIRAAICMSAVTGFVLVGLVAVIDGLIERDIRRACGGIESSKMYHGAKRMIVPILFLSIGGYLTLPISIHPTVLFLPMIGAFGLALFIWAKTFMKFL